MSEKSYLFNSPMIGVGIVRLEEISPSRMAVKRIFAPRPEYRSCATNPVLTNNPVGAINGDLEWRDDRHVYSHGTGQFEWAAQSAVELLEQAYQLHVCWAANAPRGAGDAFRPRTIEEMSSGDRSAPSLALREWMRIAGMKLGGARLIEISASEADVTYGCDIDKLAEKYFQQAVAA